MYSCREYLISKKLVVVLLGALFCSEAFSSPVLAYDKNLRSGDISTSWEQSVRTARLQIEIRENQSEWLTMGKSEYAASLGNNIGEMTANALPFLAGGVYGLIEVTRRVDNVQKGIKKKTGMEIGGGPKGSGAWFERSF